MSLFLVKDRVEALLKIGNQGIAYSEFFSIKNDSFLVFPDKFIGKNPWNLYMNGKFKEFVHFSLWDDDGNYRASDGINALGIEECRERLGVTSIKK